MRLVKGDRRIISQWEVSCFSNYPPWRLGRGMNGKSFRFLNNSQSTTFKEKSKIYPNMKWGGGSSRFD